MFGHFGLFHRRGSAIILPGNAEFITPGTYSWTAPAGVTSVSVVCVGAGGGGLSNEINQGGGAGGGGLGYKNNISVTPGQSYTVVVGAGGTTASYPPNMQQVAAAIVIL